MPTDSLENIFQNLNCSIRSGDEGSVYSNIHDLKFAIDALDSPPSDSNFSEIIRSVELSFNLARFEWDLVFLVEQMYWSLTVDQQKDILEFLCANYGRVNSKTAVMEIAEVIGSLRNPLGIQLITRWLDRWSSLSDHAKGFVEEAIDKIFNGKNPLPESIRQEAIKLGKRYHTLTKPDPLRRYAWD